MSEPIRLAVVDDSTFVRKALQRLFQSSTDVQVVGMAASGEELLENLERWNPAAVTLDLSMPGMGGLATLDRIMQLRRMPVIILSSHSSADAPLTLEALSRGAADFIDKEEFSLVDFDSLRAALLSKLQGVTRLTPAPGEAPACETAPEPPPLPAVESFTGRSAGQARTADVVLVGASTGGPPAIENILGQLQAPPSIPIVVVQHMPAGFTAAFAQRLDGKLPFSVREASHGGAVLPGTVYIAPGGVQIRLRFEGGRMTTTLSRYPETPHRPSIDVLFKSATTLPITAIAVLLTGMGNDGARGLLELRRLGALTIAQDEATSVVYGMPRCAVDLGAVQEQLPVASIGRRLRELVGLSAVHS